MNCWFSPFHLSSALVSELEESGLYRLHEHEAERKESCLLVYDSPDKLVSAAIESCHSISADEIVAGYVQLLKLSLDSRYILLAGWRIQGLGSIDFKHWQRGDASFALQKHEHIITPSIAIVVFSLLECRPDLLAAYNDLELKCELLGGRPDIEYRHYLQRLAIQSDPLPEIVSALISRAECSALLIQKTRAEQLEQQTIKYSQDLQNSLEDLRLTRQHLYHTQSELETQLISNLNIQALLNSTKHEISTLQAELCDLKKTLIDNAESLTRDAEQKSRELQTSSEEVEVAKQHVQYLHHELQRHVIEDKNRQIVLDTQNQEISVLQSDLQQLQQATQISPPSFVEEIKSLGEELRECRNTAEVSSALARQIQDDSNEQYTLLKSTRELLDIRSKELSESRSEFDELKHSLHAKILHFEEELHSRDSELVQFRDAVDLITARLHEAQEKLEHYFVLSRESRRLIEFQFTELSRAKYLLTRLNMQALVPHYSTIDVSVEVMPPSYVASDRSTGIQEQALLESYSKSLERALVLLKRVSSL